MANSWLRLWHDMPNDPKWRTIAKVSKQPITAVISIWVHILVNASNANERGQTENWNNEDIASALDLEIEQVASIIDAMQGRVLNDNRLLGWDKRQPIKEDGAAERSKAWREAKKLEKEQQQSQQNEPERKRTPDKDKDKDKDKEREREALPLKFEDLVFSEEFLKVATENGLSAELGAKSFGVWKITRRAKPPKDLLGDWWVWCLKEKKPAIVANAADKPLEGKEKEIQEVGILNWQRRASKSNSSYKLSPAQQRRLDDYEAANGTVWWDNLRYWKEKQRIAA